MPNGRGMADGQRRDSSARTDCSGGAGDEDEVPAGEQLSVLDSAVKRAIDGKLGLVCACVTASYCTEVVKRVAFGAPSCKPGSGHAH